MTCGLECSIGISSPPSAPTLSQVSGGSIAATTYYVVITYTNSIGETLASAESTLAVNASYLLKVTSPATATNATAYNIYVSTTSGSEVLQVVGTAIGTDWTEPTSGLISGVSPPTSVPLVDLDSVFLPYVSGHTKATTTGIQVTSANQELSDRFENISYGSGGSATGILATSSKVDLNTLYAAYGSGSGWTASLPSFHTFTTSPIPASGTNSMQVTTAGGPGGTYTYSWGSLVTGDYASFTIVSGSATDTIQWWASARYGFWASIRVTCTVTASSGASVKATTDIAIHYGTPS